jgi:hypothetical protein
MSIGMMMGGQVVAADDVWQLLSPVAGQLLP